ncbi:hypothetical protein MMC31_003189 [Peltigera leucophlebia]|nr:hypothetical protein [Peltigera leucophlebia]
MPPSSKPKLPVSSIAPAQKQSKIKAFGKVRKPKLDRDGDGKTKLDGKSHVVTKASVGSGVSTNSKKRKLQSSDAIDCDPAFPSEQGNPRKKRAVNLKAVAKFTNVVRSCLEISPASSLETYDPASKPTSLCLESARSSSTPPSSPAPEYLSSTPELEQAPKLPDELQDLINLYSSFLTALSLHYAHHGSLIPADVRILRPGIERAWGKRRVSNDDVRRILAIAQNLPSVEHDEKLPGYKGTFCLSDYGQGKICVEIEDDAKSQGVRRCPINEEFLNSEFVANLEAKWSQYTSKADTPAAPTFIAHLPLFPITTCASISKIAPLLYKGQRRLEDLKAGAIKAQLSSQLAQSASSNSEAKVAANIPPNNRSDSLLSRIRAKQLHQSTLAPPPSTAKILRKSTLQRLEELAPVLEILTSSASRSTFSRSLNTTTHTIRISSLMEMTEQHGTYSFTMPTLVQHLQMSLKNPISKEDAVSCVRLLATEVAPSWVKIKEVGKVIGVTVWRGGRIGREELAGRVEELLEKI